MNYTDLLEAQMKVALTNAKEDLRFVLADAKGGIAGSIYKRSTEEVDFFAMTMSNLAEPDIEGFDFGLCGIDEEGDYVFYPIEEDGTNGYLRGMDRRLIDREIPEDLQHRFEEHGHEIIDLAALFDFEERVQKFFDQNPYDLKRFKIHGEGLRDVLANLPRKYTAKDWVQRALVHMHPQYYHNEAMNEYVVNVFKEDPYTDGNWYAKLLTIEDGQPVFYTYEVDLEESRRLSDELPTDEDILSFGDQGAPMFASTRDVIMHNYRDEPYTVTKVVLKRAYNKGLRLAIQDIGPSGIRMPAQSEKHYRPITVTASKEAHIKPEYTYSVPFAEEKPDVVSAMPFTFQLDDLLRIKHIFDDEDIIEVSYVPTIDAGSTIPVRFESVKEFKTKDEDGRNHFIRKVAYVAAVRPVVNGKVVIQ